MEKHVNWYYQNKSEMTDTKNSWLLLEDCVVDHNLVRGYFSFFLAGEEGGEGEAGLLAALQKNVLANFDDFSG